MFRRLCVWLLQLMGFDPRGIFHYYDGRRWRHADPMALARAYWSTQVPDRSVPGVQGPLVPFEANTARNRIASGIGMQVQEGYADVAIAVRKAFGVKPFEQGGLTDVECDELLERFEIYMGDLKKNGSLKPISSPSTATNPDVESATNNVLPSGYASGGHNYAMPDLSAWDNRSATNQP